MNMKCVLVSFFNSHNIGDVIIGDMLYEIVIRHCEVEKLSYTGNLIINPLNPKDNSNQVYKKRIYDFLIRNKFNKIIDLYYRSVKDDSLGVFEDKIQGVDSLVIGGGNMIFDLDEKSNSVKRFDDFIKIAKKHNKNIFAISIGIGPFKTIEQEIKSINSLSHCNYISFRDKSSLKIFKKHKPDFINAFLTVDPVFLLPNKLRYKNIKQKVTIGLNIINNRLIDNDQKKYDLIIGGYVKLAECLTQRLNVKVVLFCTELNDFQSVLDVYSNLKLNNNVRTARVKSYEDLILLYEDLSLLIGTRMHSMIVAYTQEIPVIGLSYQDKVDSMFEIIKSHDYLFNYENINIDDIINCSKNILDNLSEEQHKIKLRLKQIIDKNSINNEILLKLMNS